MRVANGACFLFRHKTNRRICLSNQEVIEVDERGFSLKYAKHQLKKWTPAAVVPEQAGQPGEMGKPVHLPADQESLMREKFRLNQFNLLASDSISMNRSLPDVRLEGYANT